MGGAYCALVTCGLTCRVRDEHGGSGWEAIIIKKDLKLDAQSSTKVMCALLQWVAKKRGTRGGAWRPTWIHLAVLQPLI